MSTKELIFTPLRYVRYVSNVPKRSI